MDNQIQIHSDGINAYATITVRASRIGVFVLGMFTLAGVLLMGIIIASVNDPKPGEVFGILLAFTLIVGLPLKYLLWNLYGSEELIVNTRSISWRYSYGFYRTKLKTHRFHILGTGFESVRKDGTTELGQLVFIDYAETDHLPTEIFRTSVLVDLEELRQFDLRVRQIFAEEWMCSWGFQPFSAN